MNVIDWTIIVTYLVVMIGLSLWLARNQRGEEDYFVGGRKLPWWAVGISTMATQTSAISFISIPAFVAIKPGGGLTWLQYELAVPLAMIVVIALLVPFFRKLELISVYEYLELRFDSSVRYFISAVFLLSRSLGTGVAVYASGIVLTVALDVPLALTIVVIGAVAVIYDMIGGIKAVVYSDVIQMALLLIGVCFCIAFAASQAGGIEAAMSAFPKERWNTIDFSSGLGNHSPTPFWGFLVGGLFLYVAYYGTDQSQVQRALCTPSPDDTRKSFLLNGFARFPLTLLYILLGVAVGAVYVQTPEFSAAVPIDKPDYLIPVYIVQHLPVGIRAVVIAAILSAAMSSLDSALNSLSASTMRDFIETRQNFSVKNNLLLSKLMTLFWGMIVTGFAFLVGHISDTVIESINKIGSAFYGPILAAFTMGLISNRANSRGVLLGVLAGVTSNIFLWIFHPEIFWMWWNVIGLIVTLMTVMLTSYLFPTNSEQTNRTIAYTLLGSGFIQQAKQWIKTYVVLFMYFLFILGVMVILHYTFDKY